MSGAGTPGIIAGDVIVVSAMSNGTHVLNGITCQDSVNTTNFTQITEQRLGSSSAWYQQTFYYVAAANVPAGSNITLTPYAAATDTNFSVDVFRYALGTVTNAVVSQANTANVNQAAPALAANPLIGNLVLTFDAAAGTGALTPGVAFTAGSTTPGTATRTGNAFASASGSSTFGSTWTDAGSVVSATQTVALQNAGVGMPYKLGQATAASGAAAPVVTTTIASNANDALFCIAGTSAAAITPTGVTDSGSHTWVPLASFAAPSGMSCYIYQSLHAVTPLALGGTVTVAWSGTAQAKNVEVIACAGINATTALDLTATGSGSGNSPTATTAPSTLANNNELILSVITSGYATAGITWGAGITAMDAGVRSANAVYTSVGTQTVTNSTAPAAAGASLGAPGVWAELLVTLLPDPPSGAAGTIAITNTSPLTAGQVGVAYSNQLVATGGAPPYTWSVSAGALPGGLILEPGGGGGSSGDFTYVGVNTGPQGAPTVTAFNNNYALIGPDGCYKVFFSSFPTTWVGTLMESITQSKPGTFIYFCWNDTPSQTVISNFAKTIPTSIPAVGFCWNSEPENTGGSGLQVTDPSKANYFPNGWRDNMTRVHNAQAVTPVKLVTISTSYLAWYQQGGSNAWIPPSDTTDVYGFDFYDRKTYSAGADMSSTHGWQVWLGYVKNLGKPLAITEFGLSGWGTDAAQNTRLQADHAYLKTAFGPGGTVSQLPLYIWLYWGTGLGGGGGTINDFLGPNTEATWKGIAGTQSGSGGTGTGGGGLIVGTPTTTAGSPFSFTAKATDTAAAFGTKAFSLTVNSSSALAITTATPLPGATVGVPYTQVFTASGGTVPYTWSLQSGTWPAGLAISGQSLTGTPTTPGTSTPTLKVTDNVAATATLAVSITVTAVPAVTTTTLPAGTVGAAYSVSLAGTGGTTPYTWQTVAGTLPDGLVLDPVAGTISGTPTTPGAPVLQFQLIDAAGATALSPQMPLSIALVSTGGLPVIGRRRFGGGQLDVTFSYSGANWVKAAGVNLTFWTALVGGSQITDLTTIGGGAITSVTSDSNGFIGEFFGPSGTWKMAADANAGAGPRAWIIATDVGDEVTVLWNFLKPITG
jgi:hypothetical protein